MTESYDDALRRIQAEFEEARKVAESLVPSDARPETRHDIITLLREMRDELRRISNKLSRDVA